MKASSSNLRYADNNDAIDDHIEVVKIVDDHDVVDVDSENANGVGDEKTVDNEKKGGRRSFVWDHFIFVKGATKAPCPYCKTVIACAGKKNGTSTLASHLTNVCRTSPLYKKNIDSKKQATLGFKPISEGDITECELHESNGTLVLMMIGCKEEILNFCPIANHRGDTIGKLVYQCLQKWGIERVFTVTVDNASSNDGAIKLKLIDYKYRSYFCGDDEDDFADNTRKRKRKEKVVGAPEEDDWEKARHFIEYLRVFYNVTNLISGSKYVTSNLFFGELVTMHASISRMCTDEDEQKRAMAASMKDKYDKYWDNIDNINFLLYVAVLLDPRNKLFYLDYYLGQIYGMYVLGICVIITLVCSIVPNK
ncbi:zinc finger, BED-type containing protein [Tanacetum coccineum]